MKKPEITKGEWAAIGNEDSNYRVRVKPTNLIDHYAIQYVAEGIEQGEDAGKADATLIAAAPQMAEALEQAYKYFETAALCADKFQIVKSALISAGYTF